MNKFRLAAIVSSFTMGVLGGWLWVKACKSNSALNDLRRADQLHRDFMRKVDDFDGDVEQAMRIANSN